jgi:hypothetical protein
MTPYRVERYGLSADDFDQTRLIDVRLSPSRDTSGRLAYSPLQMERWERPSKDSVIAGGGYVVAGAFPFDVASAKQFPNKVEQLRRLAPAAAVMLSIRPFRLAEELAIAAGASPDGVILRMDDPEFEPLELAGLVRRARDLLSNKHGCDLPLWVVPGEISPRDAAKLIALGADAVAIDAWCEPVVDEAVEALQATSYQSTVRREIAAIVTDLLWPKLDLALGIMSSIPAGRRTLDGKASRDGWASRDALGSFHPRWAETCGVPLLK